jgi:hypothetical protein
MDHFYDELPSATLAWLVFLLGVGQWAFYFDRLLATARATNRTSRVAVTREAVGQPIYLFWM